MTTITHDEARDKFRKHLGSSTPSHRPALHRAAFNEDPLEILKALPSFTRLDFGEVCGLAGSHIDAAMFREAREGHIRHWFGRNWIVVKTRAEVDAPPPCRALVPLSHFVTLRIDPAHQPVFTTPAHRDTFPTQDGARWLAEFIGGA